MKDLYSIFDIPYHASLLDIAKAYQNKCRKNPASVFYYTKIFKILVYTPYKLIYDSMLFHIDVRTLFYFQSSLTEEKEYELAMVISWIDDFKDFVYDSKYYCDNYVYLELLDDWFNELVYILDRLKEHIQGFYLG